MVSSTGRLRLAPDDHSGDRTWPRVERSPRLIPWFLPDQEAGAWSNPLCEKKVSTASTHHRNEGADMHESTRTPGLLDSGTSDIAVKITPATEGPVTTTTAVA